MEGTEKVFDDSIVEYLKIGGFSYDSTVDIGSDAL